MRNGSIYMGEFKVGYRLGIGTQTRGNGDSYVGEWRGNEIRGHDRFR